MDISEKYLHSYEKIIWFLTIILYASFYIFDTSPFVSYILFIITVIITFISVHHCNYKLKIKISFFHIGIFAFSMFCIISSIWSSNPNLSIEKGITIFEILVCMTLLYAHYSSYSSINGLLKAIMFGGFLVALYTFYSCGFENIFSILGTSNRLDTVFANTNMVGLGCTISIVIAFYFCIYYKMMKYILIIIPSFLIVIVCGSRKSIIMLVVGLLLLIIYRITSKNILTGVLKLMVTIGIIFLIAPYIIELPIFSGINQRMEGIIAVLDGTGKIDHSTLVRQSMVQKGLKQFFVTPFFGIGIGNAHVIGIGDYLYLHNNYVELLTCGGLVGFLIYYSLYLNVLFNLFKNKIKTNKYSCLIIVLILIFLIMDYGAVTYYSKTTYFYFMVFYLHIRNMNETKNKYL